MKVSLLGFGGIAPKKHPKFLSNTEAQYAADCDLLSGAISSWRTSRFEQQLAKSGDIKTIYKMDNGEWLHWTEEVSVARSLLTNDTLERTYFTGTDVPRVTANTLATSTKATAGTITGATQADPVVITDVAHGLYDYAKITITGIVGMTELNDRTFYVTIIDADSFSLNGEDGTGHTAYTSGGTWSRVLTEYPEEAYRLGVPAPTAAPAAALVGTHTTPADTAYVYTFVTGWGEEGAPSPASNIVAADFTTGSVDITTMDFPVPISGYNITTYRLYRIASGTAGAEYLHVADIAVNNGTPQYNDTVDSADLGEVLPSIDWYEPPAALKGITAMANGIMAGFIGNTVYFSEPYIPSAWPTKYSLNVDYNIVGLSSFGNSLAVLTDGYPFIITGIHPSALTLSEHKELQPCINPRSIVPMMDGVAYGSPDGIYYIGTGGYQLLTKNHHSRETWRLLNPEGGAAGYYDGRYIGFFDFTEMGIVFGPRDPEETKLRELGFLATSVWSDPNGDLFYMGIQDPATLITSIYEFNAGGDHLTYTWRSKLLNSGKSVKVTALKIKGDYGVTLSQSELDALNAERDAVIADNEALIATDVKGSINSKAINEQAINADNLGVVPTIQSNTSFIVKYYVDDVVVHEVQAVNDRPMRLPRVEGIDHYIEVSGKYPIYEIILASSIRELTQ